MPHPATAPVHRVWCFCDGSAGAALGPLPSTAPRAPTAPHRASSPTVCTAASIAHGDDGRILDMAWELLPAVTNNEAEYAGLLLGLALARRLNAQEVICVLDSEVVVGQMQGRFAVHSAGLRTWHWRVCAEARRLPKVRYCLVPRAWNRLADGLAAQSALQWSALQGALLEQRTP